MQAALRLSQLPAILTPRASNVTSLLPITDGLAKLHPFLVSLISLYWAQLFQLMKQLYLASHLYRHPPLRSSEADRESYSLLSRMLHRAETMLTT